MPHPIDWIHQHITTRAAPRRMKSVSVPSELAYRSVARMLELIGKPELVQRLDASQILYRSD
jgi:hypothetical protein